MIVNKNFTCDVASFNSRYRYNILNVEEKLMTLKEYKIQSALGSLPKHVAKICGGLVYLRIFKS